MDRLLREGNPPTGQLASPKPQYKKPGVDEYEPVEGQHGAPFAILKDASGNIVSPATDAKLEQVKSELELVKSELQTIKANQLSGDQKVQLSGAMVLQSTQNFRSYGVPAFVPLESQVTDPVEIRAVDKDGNLYGSRFCEVVKSVDNGLTWTNIWTPPSEEWPGFVVPLDNGSLVVTTSFIDERLKGQVYVSDTTQTSFTKVLDTIRSLSGLSYGKDYYKNIVLFTEYGAKIQGVDSARRAYLSTDYGASFKKIFELADHYEVHTHNIQFDRYSGRIWISVGDKLPERNVYYSDDWGANWNTLWPFGESPINPLSIICLPDCVLIGSDNHGAATVWRWDRKTGIIEKTFEIPSSTTNSMLVSISGATQVLENGDVIGYIPWHTQYFTPDGIGHADEEFNMILATSDGYNFRTLWRSDKKGDESHYPVTVVGIKDGKLMVLARNKTIMKFTLPLWK